MGEKSKRIGEIGENIVANFFPLIGWHNALANQSLGCKKPEKHAIKESKKQNRSTHGIDYLYCYKSPLESSTAESVIISVKHTDKPYENSPKNTFKAHAEDLVQTLECYKNSELKKQQLQLLGRVTKNRDSGLLFWLSSNDETYDDVVAKVSNSQLDTSWIFESFHVVDNRRIQFIYDTTSLLRSRFGANRLNFYYPETSLSYVDKTIPRSGKVCPVEFLTSPILPLIIKSDRDGEQDTFCLSSIDNFDQDAMRRIIQAAREYTQDMSCKYLFLFPNYTQSHHHDAVRVAVTGFDGNISTRIEVISYRPDFRSLNNA